MKKVFLSIAMVSVTFAFAQKKEIAAAFKAAEVGDYATVNSQIVAADAILGGKTFLLDPETMEQYFYAKGLSLLKSGNTVEGASYLAKINKMGKSKIYAGKDAEKNKVYYVGKSAAEASGIQDLKEQSYTPVTSAKLGTALNPSIQNANKQAMDAYNAKNYAKAGEKFSEVYNLLKAAGQDNKQFLYYSAITYAQANKKDEAAKAYDELINSGYTGVETTYTAKNKKTGQVEALDKTAYDLYKKLGEAGDYTDFKTETSKSVEQELYVGDAELLISSEKYDQALSVIEKGLKKFPGNEKLTDLQGTAYYKSGKTDQFVATLKDKVAKNPNDFESYYNLGVLMSKDPEKSDEEALEYFKKAVEIKPDYAPALQNITFLTMGDDEKAIKDIDNARKAGKTDLFNKLLQQRRDRFAKALPYAERWYATDTNNLDAVTLLKGLYTSGKNEAKAAEFKAKEAALMQKK